MKRKNICIKLEYDEDSLKTTIDALNNAIIALNDVYGAARLGCDYPEKFRPVFEGKTFEEMDKICQSRKEALYKLYQVYLNEEKVLK